MQQEVHGHRSRKTGPLYGIRTILGWGQERLTDRQPARLDKALGTTNATTKLSSPGCVPSDSARPTRPPTWLRPDGSSERSSPGSRLARSPRLSASDVPLKQRRKAFLACFDTGRASNGGTEALNGLLELHRRVARGLRNPGHYRLRMLLIGSGRTHPHLR